MAKKFMFICIGILALAAAYAVGASRSVAQSGTPSFVGMSMNHFGYGTAAIPAEGDIYARPGVVIYEGGSAPGPLRWSLPAETWTFMGNVMTGAVDSQGTTIGGVKSLFR